MKTAALLAVTLAALSLAHAQQPAGRYPYLNPAAAYVSPAEFAAAFGGSVERVGEQWAWYHNNRAFWFNTRLNKVSDAGTGLGYDLPGTPVVVSGRVVLPARALTHVAACVVTPTRPLDATVTVACGGRRGTLKRY